MNLLNAGGNDRDGIEALVACVSVVLNESTDSSRREDSVGVCLDSSPRVLLPVSAVGVVSEGPSSLDCTRPGSFRACNGRSAVMDDKLDGVECFERR